MAASNSSSPPLGPSPSRAGIRGSVNLQLITADEAIAAITQRLIETCQPLRIYLFGSVARGDAGPDSDLDFLVVVPDNSPEDIFRSSKLSDALWGISHAADVIPWRQTDFEGRAAYVVASLPATVLREGMLLYDTTPVAA